MNYLFSKIFKVIILFYKRAISPFFTPRCEIDKIESGKGLYFKVKEEGNNLSIGEK